MPKSLARLGGMDELAGRVRCWPASPRSFGEYGRFARCRDNHGARGRTPTGRSPDERRSQRLSASLLQSRLGFVRMTRRAVSRNGVVMRVQKNIRFGPSRSPKVKPGTGWQKFKTRFAELDPTLADQHLVQHVRASFCAGEHVDAA